VIPEEKEHEILRLLAQETPLQAIAHRTGVSYNTIHRIATATEGRWRRKRNGNQEWIRNGRRCPGCGAKVTRWPCLFCNPVIGITDENKNAHEIERKRTECQPAVEFQQIAEDIIALDNLGLIDNVLLSSLADRARESVGRLREKRDDEKNSRTTH